MVYSRFIDGLNKAGIEVDRKVLSDIAINEPAVSPPSSTRPRPSRASEPVHAHRRLIGRCRAYGKARRSAGLFRLRPPRQDAVSQGCPQTPAACIAVASAQRQGA